MEDALKSTLTQLAAAAPGGAEWQPHLLRLGSPADREALGRLVASGQVRTVHDTLSQQLGGLIETRQPSRRFSAADLAREVEARLRPTPPEEYGVWAFFPWSGRLVHLLPEEEFRELRSSRNHNKITPGEQQALRGLRVGVVGLSMGRVSAITLALEGVGGTLRLADFDHFELSNLNRLHLGVHGLGVNKAVQTARDIFELDPFAQLEIFPRGVTEETLDELLVGEAKLDVLLEECDELNVKMLLRERARHLGIPVVMETSDRGLIDVERFDREPRRPLFHGLTGTLGAADLKGLTSFQKVPILLKLIGVKDISGRMAASLVDVEATLKTWPQLASGLALGAALNTDVIRRIGLGQFNDSGRFYVDLEELVADGKGRPVDTSVSFEVSVSPQALKVELPPLRVVAGEPSEEDLRALIAHGASAASGGNCQPWRFLYQEGRLRCFLVPERARSFLDYRSCASHLAFGSVAENLHLAALAMGLKGSVTPFPERGDPLVVCDVSVSPAKRAPGGPDDLVRWMAERSTNRRLGPRRPVSSEQLERLDREAASRGGRLQWLTGDDQLAAIADILGRGDRVRFLSKAMHQDLTGELRWSAEEVERTRDGIDLATLELTPTDVAGLRLVSSWPLMKLVAGIGGGLGLLRPTQKAVESASAVGLLTVQGADPQAFFDGGRAIQRVWLRATALGLAFQPMTALTYLFLRAERGAEELSRSERKELAALRADYRRLFDLSPGWVEPMLFRIAVAAPPSARALRRRVDEILSFE